MCFLLYGQAKNKPKRDVTMLFVLSSLYHRVESKSLGTESTVIGHVGPYKLVRVGLSSHGGLSCKVTTSFILFEPNSSIPVFI